MISRIYDRTIRPVLPRKIGVFSGVAVRRPKLFDLTDHVSDYKAGMIGEIDARIIPGDDVSLIAGGLGVSSVRAARAGGNVVAYEGARQMVRTSRETIETNYLGDGSVKVKHAIVGEAIDLYGDADGARIIPPSNLDPGDVLVLDCEGAERSILSGIKEWPRTVVCEEHPGFGVPAEETISLLEQHYSRVYTVENYPTRPDDCERVVVATGGDGQ